MENGTTYSNNQWIKEEITGTLENVLRQMETKTQHPKLMGRRESSATEEVNSYKHSDKEEGSPTNNIT